MLQDLPQFVLCAQMSAQPQSALGHDIKPLSFIPECLTDGVMSNGQLKNITNLLRQEQHGNTDGLLSVHPAHQGPESNVLNVVTTHDDQQAPL